jgi:hypothetical protein
MLKSYGFAFAGLVAIGAGAVAPGSLSVWVKSALTIAIIAICVLLYLFVRNQRIKTDEGFAILRTLEKHWGVIKSDEAQTEFSLLPPKWCRPVRLHGGLTPADWYQVGGTWSLGGLILLAIWLLPLNGNAV